MRLTIIVPEIRDKTLLKKLTKLYPKDEIISFKQRSFDIIQKMNHFISTAKWSDIVLVSMRDKTILPAIKDTFRKEGTYYNNSDNFRNVYWNTTLKFNRDTVILPEEQDDYINNAMEFGKWIVDNNTCSEENIIQVKAIKPNTEINVLSDMKMDSNRTRKSKIRTDVYNPQTKTTKPKILLIADVIGWAWWNKSLYLKKYLSDDFHIDIIAMDSKRQKINPNSHDVYFTFGFSYVDFLRRVPFNKRVTGITAHRSLKLVKPKMKQAKTIHANSIMLMKEAEKIHNNVFYVPNGVDEKLFTPDENKLWNESPIVAGHVGKLCNEKGQKRIIEPAIKRTGVDYIPHYNNYMNMLSLKEMKYLYHKMNVFLVASSMDGTPNPGLESMASGIPVISNKIGNMPEIIKTGYNGVLLDDLGISSYVRALKKYSIDNWKEMGYNARKTIEEGWTWKIQAENYRKLFWSVINGS